MIQSFFLNNVENARELGGYITADGKSIRHGVLLRTAKLADASDEDISKLRNEFNLGYVIDFRMDQEKYNANDPVIDGAEYYCLNVLDYSSEDMDELVEGGLESLDLIEFVKISEQSGMLSDTMYIDFLEGVNGKKGYSGFFRLLTDADPDKAFLWHCTSGKDRTGLAAMMLLSLFGVDEDTIMKDYLLTNKYNDKSIQAVKKLIKNKGYDDAFSDKAALVFKAVRKEWMINALKHLNKEYGSVTGYIRNALMIPQADIDKIKEKYLTNG